MECVEASHSCEEQPDEDGSPCDDDFDCTDHDSCRGGVCKGTRTLGLGQWAEFYECLAGTDHGIETDCECMDLDGDGHVDLNDIAEFMREFTGP
jgi:hypothetical protein